MSEENKKGAPAAYLPFKTFLSSVEALDHGLPSKLDRSIWRGQSGIVQGQIMMAFRFLRLIDEQDQPTSRLSELIARSEVRPKVVGVVLQEAYRKLFELDLTKTTPKMLEDAMSAYGVQGDTRRKAVAFFLRAARYAEIPMHLLLTAQIRNTSGGLRRKRKIEPSVAVPEISSLPAHNGTGAQTVSKSLTLTSGTVVTLNITANWLDMEDGERKFVYGLRDQLQRYSTELESDEDEGEDE